MPKEEVLTDKSALPNNQLANHQSDQERGKRIERLRSMTIEEKFEQLARLYFEGQKIDLTEEERATREAEKEEIREQWNRLRRAHLTEQVGL